MGEYNEKLRGAGVLLALDGLTPPAAGARVSFAGGKATVTDGPFAETKEVFGGYWMIRVNSREEAIDWARRCPAGANDIIVVGCLLSRLFFGCALEGCWGGARPAPRPLTYLK